MNHGYGTLSLVCHDITMMSMCLSNHHSFLICFEVKFWPCIEEAKTSKCTCEEKGVVSP